MASPDDRIVTMRFDNENFQRKVSDTMTSLDKLQNSLRLADSTRGLTDLQAAGDRFNLNGLHSAVEGIGSKFSAMSVVAISALATITSMAVSTGVNLLRSLTLDPLMQGFHEYETNLNSIQTILANTGSKGTSLDEVNGALDQLNHYSDQTIYNFSEMARNIGTFTAAGVDLDTAVSSIKGIANLAALSGSSAMQASTAMYQLSQAISAGRVALMDWNSVVNAGMGGELFKSALFETGKMMGTLQGVPMAQTFTEWEDSGNSFRTSLSQTGNTAASVAKVVDHTAEARKDAAKSIARAEENAAESIENSQKAVAKAHENVADVAEASSKAMADAVEQQQEASVRSAESVEDALERAVEAKRRLDEAMKPASEDDLEAATDRVTSAQLDQADVATAIEDARREQARAAEDLAAAEKALKDAQESPDTEQRPQDIARAQRQLEDAQRRSLDLEDSIERARLRQNAATRDLHQAEADLNTVREQGSETDQNVIDAQADLVTAEENLVDVQEDAAQSAIDSAERVAQVTEDTADRQIDAQERLAEAEKQQAKVAKDSAEAVADAHESAAKRIESAVEAAAASARSASSSGQNSLDTWLTDEVLTTTLSAIAGDLDQAELMAMGFSEEQAARMVELGRQGQAAAQDVKTFTQLMSTVRENIGSSWAQTFRAVVGDFEQARQLFTGINNAIKGIVDRTGAARNNLLEGWAAFGGRNLLIEGFVNVFKALGDVLRPIGQAFRDIFPPMTVERLVLMTQSFRDFSERMQLSQSTMAQLRVVARGFFAAFEIGWEIVKGVFGLVGDVLSALQPLGSTLFDFASTTSQSIFDLNEALVAGGGIKDFFEKLSGWITNPMATLMHFKEVIAGLFSDGGIPGAAGAETMLGRIGDRFKSLGDTLDTLAGAWDWLSEKMNGVTAVLDHVWDYVSNWFGDLGSRLVDTFSAGDFDAVVDMVNVGLLGGIALILRNFMRNGLRVDIGAGIMDRIRNALDGLTGTLQAMQQSLQAQTLQRIAIAIGILTAALVVLSMIDSAALTRALGAMAIGFGQLMGAFALMNQASQGIGIARLGGLAASLVILAGAMLILSLAVKVLSTMGWEELARGLAGVGVSLAIMITAINRIAEDTSGMIRAGIAVGVIAVGLRLLAEAVEEFGAMGWEEMAQGLLGIGVSLGIMVTAMNRMPTGDIMASAVAIGLIAGALRLLQEAVQEFGEMAWQDMARGLAGIAASLVILVTAMNAMPTEMIMASAIATGLIAGALFLLAKDVEEMGSIPFGEMAKGIGAIAAMLAILAVAMLVMGEPGTLAGAVALGVVAASLLLMTEVLETLGNMSIAELVTSLVALAAVLAVLGAAGILLAEAVIPLMGLGIALALIGGGFAAFGFGVSMIAKAIQILAESGSAAIRVISELLDYLISRAPQLAVALANAVIHAATSFVEGMPQLLEAVKVLLIKILETVVELAPKIADALIAIISSTLRGMRELFPQILQTGIDILLTLLRGIRDNIREIIDTATEMIVSLVQGLIHNMPRLVAAAADLIISFITEVSDHARELVAAGLGLIVSLLEGITDNISLVVDAVGTLIITFISELVGNYLEIIDAGFELLKQFLLGITGNIIEVVRTVATIVAAFIDAIVDSADLLIDSGFNALKKFLSGIGNNLIEVTNCVGALATEFITAVGNNAQQFVTAGGDALVKFLDGIAEQIPHVIKAGVNIVIQFIKGIGDAAVQITNAALDVVVDLIEGMADAINLHRTELEDAGKDLIGAIIDGMTFGWAHRLGGFLDAIPGVGPLIDTVLRDSTETHSPSKMTMRIGRDLAAGFALGFLQDKSAAAGAAQLGQRTIDAFGSVLSKAPSVLGDMDALNPVITPVLDLTNVRAESGNLQKLLSAPTITPEVSANVAREIAIINAENNSADDGDESGYSGPREVTFEQTINSPKALSTGEIYRNTRSQFALAKEELGI